MSRTDADAPSSRPLLESRRQRLHAYLRHNHESMLADAVVLFSWILLIANFGQWFDLPRWFVYIAVFVGVVLYTQTTVGWSRPYRSPD